MFKVGDTVIYKPEPTEYIGKVLEVSELVCTILWTDLILKDRSPWERTCSKDRLQLHKKREYRNL
jgi:hypothetical protein